VLKLLETDDSFFGGEPQVTLLDLEHREGFTKQASDSRISEYVAGIKSEPGKIYLHILAMGAGEWYGANRNADYFPEENLKKHHQTFVTSPAHIFKNHVNKDPGIAIGQVVFAVYNEKMHRVEVIAWVDRVKGADVVTKVEQGQFPATSMACHTPYDTCSICGNQAKSRAEYCTHLTNELGKIYPDGRKVMSINDAFLRFFDMSMVFRPADVTSSVLQKVAFARNEVVGSAELAENYDLKEKQASFKKLSELIKELEGNVVASSPSLEKLLSRVKDPDEEVINTLIGFDLHHVINALAELGISPSVEFFAKLISQKIVGQGVNLEGIGELTKSAMVCDAESLSFPTEIPSDIPRNLYAIQALLPFAKQASIFPQDLYGIATGPVGDQGFYGRGPDTLSREPQMLTIEEHRAILAHAKENSSPGMLKTLFMIGGAAVAAKWLVTKLIEQKMEEHRRHEHFPAKIALVKSAGEAQATQNLVKAKLLRDLKY